MLIPLCLKNLQRLFTVTIVRKKGKLSIAKEMDEKTKSSRHFFQK